MSEKRKTSRTGKFSKKDRYQIIGEKAAKATKEKSHNIILQQQVNIKKM